MKTDGWLRVLLILLVIIAALYLLNIVWQLGVFFADIILLFFLSWLLAFIMAPLARLVFRSRLVPWWASVLSVYVLLLLIVGALIFVIAPITIAQLIQLGTTLPSYVERLPDIQAGLQKWLDERGVPLQINTLYEAQSVTQWARNLGSSLGQYALGLAQGTAFVVVEIVIVLVLSFYIMLDGERISLALLRLLPLKYRDEGLFMKASVERTFGGFLRGSVILGIVYGTVTALVMSVQGLSFVLPVSAFSGAIIIIPFLGPILALVPPVIVAVFSGSLGVVLFVLISLLVVQQIILQVIFPKLMSQSVGMHPLLIFLAVLAGAKLAGIWGILFGVPILAAFYSMGTFLYERSREPDKPGEISTRGDKPPSGDI